MKTELDELRQPTARVMKVERLYPSGDWERTWNYLSTRGLSGEQRSFLFKFLHNILPTKKRLFRMKLAESPDCELCEHGLEGDLQHSLLSCDHNNVVNDWLIGVLIDLDPGLVDCELSARNILTLDFQINDCKKLAVLFFLTLVFEFIWKKRQAKKSISLMEVHAMILADVSILKQTRFINEAKTIESALNFDICF